MRGKKRTDTSSYHCTQLVPVIAKYKSMHILSVLKLYDNYAVISTVILLSVQYAYVIHDFAG